jgi:protein-S-isoprenylcysteine O-methyltransferase Ste14
MTHQHTSTQCEHREPLYGLGDLLKVVVMLAILVGAMALLAGRWDWMAGWVFLGIFTVYSLVLFVWLSVIDPGLARERRRDADERNQPYERVIIPLMVILELSLLIVATLDGGRFGWSTVPVWARVAGWSLLAVAGAVLPWVFHTNTFASGVGRIQDDREHHVITNGPYRYVRHPMYTGVIIGFIGLPLALGSWWALIPGGLLILTFIYRTWQEDRFLTVSLPGYAEYAQQTRCRLLPGIW